MLRGKQEETDPSAGGTMDSGTVPLTPSLKKAETNHSCRRVPKA